LNEWRERFPAASVLELPDAGHFLIEDAGTEIKDHLNKFFDNTAHRI
jgi:pimeloyl-ACP methyl ester carboxylesterase